MLIETCIKFEHNRELDEHSLFLVGMAQLRFKFGFMAYQPL